MEISRFGVEVHAFTAHRAPVGVWLLNLIGVFFPGLYTPLNS